MAILGLLQGYVRAIRPFKGHLRAILGSLGAISGPFWAYRSRRGGVLKARVTKYSIKTRIEHALNTYYTRIKHVLYTYNTRACRRAEEGPSSHLPPHGARSRPRRASYVNNTY